MGDYSAWHALTGEHGPAPKEGFAMQVEETLICRLCKNHYTTDLKDTLICDTCREKGAIERAIKKKEEQRTILRAVYDKAYFAALGGCLTDSECSGPVFPEHAVKYSHSVALETVRQWSAMQVELDALIGEMG